MSYLNRTIESIREEVSEAYDYVYDPTDLDCDEPKLGGYADIYRAIKLGLDKY